MKYDRKAEEASGRKFLDTSIEHKQIGDLHPYGTVFKSRAMECMLSRFLQLL